VFFGNSCALLILRELDPTLDREAAVGRDEGCGPRVAITMLDTVDGVAEGAGWATLERLHDLLDAGLIRLASRLLAHSKDCA
jgi:hypothetical protein